MTTELNGWNVETMTEAIEGVKQNPEAGPLTWRGRAVWDGGFGLNVHTTEIEQLGQVMKRRFTLRGDHPPELLGNNTGATAIETFLAALGSCMAGTFAAQATARGVELEALEVDIEGVIDLNGFFGLKPINPGLYDVKLTFRVQSDADAGALEEILAATQSLSPIFNSATKPVGVEATVVSA